MIFTIIGAAVVAAVLAYGIVQAIDNVSIKRKKK